MQFGAVGSHQECGQLVGASAQWRGGAGIVMFGDENPDIGGNCAMAYRADGLQDSSIGHVWVFEKDPNNPNGDTTDGGVPPPPPA
eukprot:COSAG04_NODE_12275_length_661_cov_0.476868_1_plen_84_part_01